MGSSRNYMGVRAFMSFEERLRYLMLYGKIGDETFGRNRHLNQVFYKDDYWLEVRDHIIVRDNGCDLGIPEYPIQGTILVHHIVPITEEDILNRSPILFDENNLISVSLNTHNIIHYGNDDCFAAMQIVERRPNDMCPWR